MYLPLRLNLRGGHLHVRLMLCTQRNWTLIFTSFKRHIRTGLKNVKNMDFFRLFIRKTSTKMTCNWHAASRYAQRSPDS